MVEDLNIARQEPIPPATEIDCIETNKVFDECLVRDCFASPGLVVSIDPSCITGVTCADFKIKVNNPIVPTRKSTDEPGFVRVSFSFTINYNLIITTKTSCTPTVVAAASIVKNVSNVLLYCPEPIAYTLTQTGTEAPVHTPNKTIKLEFIGECVDVDYLPNPSNPCSTTITTVIGYYLVIKCEQMVQLQVLSRGYCVAPFCTSPTIDPCSAFLAKPIPSFFPVQRAPF